MMMDITITTAMNRLFLLLVFFAAWLNSLSQVSEQNFLSAGKAASHTTQ